VKKQMSDATMVQNLPIVAIDGPAGSGKSSVAREVALHLGFSYVTTGALYRALALIFREQRLDYSVLQDVQEAACLLAAGFRQDSATGAVFMADREISAIIKSPELSELASVVAQETHVREMLLPIQRDLVRSCVGAVVDGRDMGTVVFPDAQLKVFLTATPTERAKRRAKELARLGKPFDQASLVAEIDARDKRDSTRAVAPLVAASDAVVIDSTQLDLDAVVSQIVALCATRGIAPSV
jgi:cytidylate kinase